MADVLDALLQAGRPAHVSLQRWSILIILAHRCSEDGAVSVSRDEIAHALGMDRSNVARAIAALEECRLLVRTRTGGGRGRRSAWTIEFSTNGVRRFSTNAVNRARTSPETGSKRGVGDPVSAPSPYQKRGQNGVTTTPFPGARVVEAAAEKDPPPAASPPTPPSSSSPRNGVGGTAAAAKSNRSRRKGADPDQTHLLLPYAGGADASIASIVQAANDGLRANPQVGTFRPIAADERAERIVYVWLRADVSAERARSIVYEVASRYEPSRMNPQIRSMRYFDHAIQERASRPHPDSEAARVNARGPAGELPRHRENQWAGERGSNDDRNTIDRRSDDNRDAITEWASRHPRRALELRQLAKYDIEADPRYADAHDFVVRTMVDVRYRELVAHELEEAVA